MRSCWARYRQTSWSFHTAWHDADVLVCGAAILLIFFIVTIDTVYRWFTIWSGDHRLGHFMGSRTSAWCTHVGPLMFWWRWSTANWIASLKWETQSYGLLRKTCDLNVPSSPTQNVEDVRSKILGMIRPKYSWTHVRHWCARDVKATVCSNQPG